MTILDATRDALIQLPRLYGECRKLLEPGTAGASEIRAPKSDAPVPIDLGAEAWCRQIHDVVTTAADQVRTEMGIPGRGRRRHHVAVDQDCEFLHGVASSLVEDHRGGALELIDLTRKLRSAVGEARSRRRKDGAGCVRCGGVLWQDSGSEAVYCGDCGRSMTSGDYQQLVVALLEAVR